MCSWTVVEVVNYFSRKGSPVFAALLDYRKAFDFVNPVKIGRGVSNIFLRLLMFIYLYQRCYIKWQSARNIPLVSPMVPDKGASLAQGGALTLILIQCLSLSGGVDMAVQLGNTFLVQ